MKNLINLKVRADSMGRRIYGTVLSETVYKYAGDITEIYIIILADDGLKYKLHKSSVQYIVGE